MDVHAIPPFTHWRWQPEATLWSKRKVGLCVGYMLPSSYWASMIAQWVKNPPAMQEIQFNSWVGKICWRRDRLPTPVFLGFPCGSVGKESACNARDLGLIPGLGRSPGEVFWPGEFHGLYSPRGHKESDTTEWLSLSYPHTGVVWQSHI